ncbi:MAG: adaptor protein MecA [Lachnospiraceae bacterium]|nr:adaptor protein MecA [Lachnospiraceae bacterium]
MYFWKLDEETIRCLLDKQEIDDMGYDLRSLAVDEVAMQDFINQIVVDSRKYINWNTDNGVQTYAARELTGDQYVLTISCTLKEDAINRDVDQIDRMTDALNGKVSKDRLEEIRKLTGQEKEEAFNELAKDLYNVVNGRFDEGDQEDDEIEWASTDGRGSANSKRGGKQEGKTAKGKKVSYSSTVKNEVKETLPPQKLIFHDFDTLQNFCHMLTTDQMFEADLFRMEDEFILLVSFDRIVSKVHALAFMMLASEFGAESATGRYDAAYLGEHGDLMVRGTALMDLRVL